MHPPALEQQDPYMQVYLPRRSFCGLLQILTRAVEILAAGSKKRPFVNI